MKETSYRECNQLTDIERSRRQGLRGQIWVLRRNKFSCSLLHLLLPVVLFLSLRHSRNCFDDDDDINNNTKNKNY